MIERKLIMLPGPTNVPDRVLNSMIKPIINHRGPEFRKLYQEITENLKYLFQTQSDVFILSTSGTGGIECAISNIVEPNDKVLVPVFGIFSERLKEKIKRRGGVPIELNLEWGTAPKASEIKEILEKEPDVKAIAMVYNETSTGVTVRELPKIGEIAKEKGILLIVDAISILGGDKLPVDEWNIDICIGGSQKCIACPPGLAVVSVSQKAWETIEKTKNKPMYFDLTRMREYAERKETPFTPALPIFYALNEALEIIKEEGLEKRFQRHKKCAEAFYAALEKLGLTAFPKDRTTRSNTVIAVNVPTGVDNAKVREIMREKYKIVIAGGIGELKPKIFRIGCMGIISQAEVLMTINALENALMDVGYNVNLGIGTATAREIFKS